MRANWEEYFMNIAKQVATRSTCDRKHVGAVIVRDKTILSTGYNGSIRGLQHCDESGHIMENGHCVATVHAESNAIAQAARNGVMINDAELFITAFPCWLCFKLIVNSGIIKIFYEESYHPDEKVIKFAAQKNIDLLQIQPPVNVEF